MAQPSSPAHQHQPGCAHWAEQQRKKDQLSKPSLLDTQSYTLRPDALKYTAMVAKLEQQLHNMATGKENPTALRRKLEAQYMQMLHRRTIRASNIDGAKMLKVIYKRPGENVTLFMDYLPSDTGIMVLGICPECFVNAPVGINHETRTKATFIEQRLAWIKGNPEADSKVVTFQISSSTFTISLDGPNKNRLTVREPVVCPSGRHGPEQRLAGLRKCDAVYRIENGIMERRSRILRNSGDGKKRPITGPIIIVK
jgi:hypothetical protein